MSMPYNSYWKGLARMLMGMTKGEVERADVSNMYRTSSHQWEGERS